MLIGKMILILNGLLGVLAYPFRMLRIIFGFMPPALKSWSIIPFYVSTIGIALLSLSSCSAFRPSNNYTIKVDCPDGKPVEHEIPDVLAAIYGVF